MQDAVVRAAAVLTTNFNADMAAIVADHGVAVVSQVATVYADREWAVFCELDTFTQAQPGIGVYASGARTNARRQNEREWIVLVVAEYYARASDPAKLKVQARLAAEAILRSIDRMNEGLTGSRILDAGNPDLSVQVELSRTADLPGPSDGVDASQWFEELCRVTFPVIDQEIIP